MTEGRDKMDSEVPDLDLAPPRPKPATSASPGAPAAGPSYDEGDDDDMILDRNAMPDVNAGRAAPYGGGGSGASLDLGDPVAPQARFSDRSHAKITPKRARYVQIWSAILVVVVAALAEVAFLRYLHRAAGWALTPHFPAAFDGNSAVWSGATALLALAVCIGFAIAGAYASPRSTGFFLASLAMLIAAIAMVTVTLAVGPDGAVVPPDGARLVPWTLPFVPLGVGLRLLRVAWERCDEGRFSERATGAAIAALAAGVAFVGVELAFGAGLGHLL